MTEPVTIMIAGEGKNALGSGLMKSLLAHLRAAGDAPILLTGHGDAFSAGLDLKEVASLGHQDMQAFLRLLERLVVQIFDHPAPVVAAINGHAIAGGLLLALAADRPVATTNLRARIGLNEVPLGLQFPPILFRTACYALPPSTRDELLLEGALHDPQDARRLGLVHELHDDPVGRGADILDKLAAIPPGAFRAAKASLRAGITKHNALEDSRFVAEIVPTWVSPELKARLNAVLR